MADRLWTRLSTSPPIVPQAIAEPLMRRLAPGLAAVALGSLVLFDVRVLNDGDTLWHIATGQWILNHGRVPTVDVFSCSEPGIRWVAQEWLSEVVMAAAWRVAGWAGLVIPFAAATAASAWLIVRHLSRSVGGLTLVLTSVLAFTCMAGSMLARPHLLALPLLIAWTLGMMAAREREKAPPLVLALLMTVWANMHGGFVLGFVVLGAFALEAVAEAGPNRIRAVRDWGLFGGASVLAALITPHGVEGFIYPFQVMTMSALPGIVEWRAADFTTPTAFEAAVLVTVFVGFSRGVRVPVFRLLLLIGLTHLALQHTRHQMVLAALAPLIMAEPLGRALGYTPSRPRLGPGLTAAFAGVALLAMGARLLNPIIRGDGPTYPATALARLPADLKRLPVLNEYGFGGYMIFAGVRPFIDGRSDMYGDRFTRTYFAAQSGGARGLDALADRYGIGWTIFSADNPVVSTLDGDPKWRRVYSDQIAVVHQRLAPANAIKIQPTSTP
jgi:hypothetical protein